MAAIIIVSALAMAGMAIGATTAPIHTFNPTPTHTAQLDLDFVKEKFKKTGSHSAIKLVVPLASVSSYAGPNNYSNYAINAPINCVGEDTYDGYFAWVDGIFDPNRCADACTARTQYNLANGLSDRPCRFFNTYLLSKNGSYFAQYCSVYTQLWDASYATNPGQFDSDGDDYTISQSIGYYNSSDPGPCQPPSSTTATLPPTKPPNLNPTASCDANGYVIQNNVLGRLNFTTARIGKNVITAGTSIDAMGYNSLDSYLYASNSALGVSNLIQLGGTGLLRSIAPLPPNSARQNWNNGDVDEKGQYWASYNGGDWIQVDLAPGSSTYGQVVASGRADSMGFTTLDWVYVPGTGNVLWALGTAFNHDQTELMSFDRTNHTWSLVNNFSKTAGANAWSAAYAGPNQSIIASEATTGQIWQFPLLGTGNKATRLSVGLPASNSDGALCVDTLL